MSKQIEDNQIQGHQIEDQPRNTQRQALLSVEVKVQEADSDKPAWEATLAMLAPRMASHTVGTNRPA